MTPSDPSIDPVAGTLDALRRIAASGAHPTASRGVLARIAALGRGGERAGAAGEPPGPPQSTAPAPRKAADPAALDSLRNEALACRKCPHLAASRRHVVFGVGNPAAELMFVGEAPGADEDVKGEPFIGPAGRLLTRIIEAMGYRREDVYIANVLKCRPDMPAGQSGNRRPSPEEMQTCLPYLKRQIELIQPRAIVALGAVAMEGLFGNQQPMKNLRGRWHALDGIPVMATYHPAYLLRRNLKSDKRKVWDDMQKVLAKLGKKISQ